MEKKFIINDTKVVACDYGHKGNMISFSIEGKQFTFYEVDKSSEFIVLKDESGKHFKVGISAGREKDESHICAPGIEDLFISSDSKSSRKKSSVGGGSLQSPMPGKIVKVMVSEGDEVKKSQPLLILEAMKMEHSIKSPRDGKVVKIFFSEGDQVQGKVELLSLSGDDTDA
ncbi:MAG: biotin/lipoyl-binding protein [Bacteriovoracaceae bacterium]|jgi:biotin carboxyl carrier protein|nr:biotin/lipoyl-binding protein [Bacteriovoracaceae bacterium]